MLTISSGSSGRRETVSSSRVFGTLRETNFMFACASMAWKLKCENGSQASDLGESKTAINKSWSVLSASEAVSLDDDKRW